MSGGRRSRPLAAGQKRKRAERAGRWAEALAAWWLRLSGYRILDRRIRTRGGEIDLVARRGRVLAIVEVKVRPTLSDAAYAIGPQQRRRLLRAAEAYRQSHRLVAGLDIRFDAILIVPWRMPVHIRDAWRE